MRKSFKLSTLVAAAALMVAGVSAQAATNHIVPGSIVTPLVGAGDYAYGFAGGYNAANKVDANLSTSPFSGVVSINIQFDGNGAGTYGSSFICSGAMISSIHILTAAHCVDKNDDGVLVDFTNTGVNRVRTIFNSNGTFNDIRTVTSVWMHPDYDGFGNCPVGVNSFCLNDDIAILTLSAAAPVTAKSYKVLANPLTQGQQITMVGYGTSGNGQVGHVSGTANFFVKKAADNRTDLFDLDDEQGFVGGPKEVYYADYDGSNFFGEPRDLFCTLDVSWGPVCTGGLGTNIEGNIGGGDSGGPSFVWHNGEYVLVANNTFGGTYPDQKSGVYGTYFGGMALAGYIGDLEAATGGAVAVVPEPETYALLLAGLAVVGSIARRRRAA